MKNNIALTILALGLTLPAVHLNAQDDSQPAAGPGGPRGDRPRPPVPPLFAALDLNHDGVIDAKELSSAADSLKALDKNNDGQLTPDELRPLRPARGPGRPGAAGPEGDQPPDHQRPQRDQAQTADGQPGPGPGHRPGPPLVAALDANHDGVIDASEIANATAALKALDKNNDGQLTRDEIHPGGPRGKGPRSPRGDRPRKPASESDSGAQQ